LVVLNAPESFEAELKGLENVKILRDPKSARKVQFILSFVTQQSEVDGTAKALKSKLEGDALVWFVYPKGSSKRYKCEFNRYTGWAAVGEQGLEPVRQVAIDEDWSALRFRHAEFIKNLTRGSALTAEGKEWIGKK